MSTAYLYDERCLWHNPGQFALLAPVGGFVQPGAEHPDNPETKRRLHNLLQVSGLHQKLDKPELDLVSDEDLLRVHSAEYLSRLAGMSAGTGGDGRGRGRVRSFWRRWICAGQGRCIAGQDRHFLRDAGPQS